METNDLNPFLALALQDVAAAEIAKGPSISASAWRKLHDVCAAILGDDALPQPQPIVGRQPATMPIQRRPIGIGAILPQLAEAASLPTAPALAVVEDIRQRPDVAAELARVAQGQRLSVLPTSATEGPPQTDGQK